MVDETGVTRVALVEDHDMVREGLIALLSSNPDFEIVGTASSLGEARREMAAWGADVVVVDYHLPDGRGTDLAVDVAAPVLLISGATGPRVISEAVQTGCAGFVSKDQGIRDLADHIAVVARGGSVFPRRELRDLTSATHQSEYQPMTARELDVLKLLAHARSVPEIADELTVSHHTVRNHIRSLLSKLQARNQLEAIVNALRAGLVRLDD